jgi:hypothetical protein
MPYFHPWILYSIGVTKASWIFNITNLVSKGIINLPQISWEEFLIHMYCYSSPSETEIMKKTILLFITVQMYKRTHSVKEYAPPITVWSGSSKLFPTKKKKDGAPSVHVVILAAPTTWSHICRPRRHKFDSKVKWRKKFYCGTTLFENNRRRVSHYWQIKWSVP